MKKATREQLAALGRDLSPAFLQSTVALLAKTAGQPDPRHGDMLYDQAYGDHERHRVDIYGAQPGAARPIVVYVHGGGFIAGDKGGATNPFYRNIGAWATANGMIGAVPNYRLATTHPWPGGRDDVIKAIDWLRENARKFGGDPDQVWLMGQSAGAAHAAAAVVELSRQGREDVLAGAILTSGVYDPTQVDAHPGNVAYYGADMEKRKDYDSVPGLARAGIPCLFTISELDPVMFQKQAMLVVQEFVAARGEWPRVVYLPHHNHLSPAQTLASTEEDDLGPVVLGFMQDVLSRGA